MSIDNEEAGRLEGPYEEEELFAEQKSINGDNVSGKMGFPLQFLSHASLCWRRINMDSNCFEKSLNAYFIALFPKKVGEPDIQSGL